MLTQRHLTCNLLSMGNNIQEILRLAKEIQTLAEEMQKVEEFGLPVPLKIIQD